MRHSSSAVYGTFVFAVLFAAVRLFLLIKWLNCGRFKLCVACEKSENANNKLEFGIQLCYTITIREPGGRDKRQAAVSSDQSKKERGYEQTGYI